MKTQWITPLASLGAGFALGYLAWSDHAPLTLLLFLPLLYGAGRPLTAAFLMLGYFLGSYTTEPDAYLGQFAWNPFLAWAITLLHALIMATPYAIGAILSNNRAWQRGLAWAFALLLSSAPPLGSIGVLTPLFIAADLCPGCGNLGVLFAILVTSLLAAIAHAVYRSHIRSKPMLIIGAGATTLWLVLLTPGNASDLQPPKGWVGLNTCYPGGVWTLKQAHSYQEDAHRRIQEAKKAGNSVIVLPENIAGEWKYTRYLWDQTRAYAEEHRITILLGASTGDTHKTWQNAVIGLGSDIEHDKAHLALQPVPLGSWKPWSEGSAQSFWMTRPNTLVIDGQYTALSLCYENVILWPMVWRSAQFKPDIIVAMINHAWEPTGSRIHNVQKKAIEAQARLWGAKLVSSRNMPSTSCTING